jgi:putative FmdB family regulatory protein
VPIYEYACQSCQHRFEVKQKISDPPVPSCIRCGQAVTKVISAPAIMFKGSGWYVTDYSDKLKPPTQPDAAGAPANGQQEKKGQEASAPSSQAASSSPAPSTSDASGSAPSSTEASTSTAASSSS